MAMIFLVVYFPPPPFALDAGENATGIPYKSTEVPTDREIAGTDVTVRFMHCEGVNFIFGCPCIFYK
jgi:hypothetical protein